MSFITVTDSEMIEEIEEGCGDWEIVEEGKWTRIISINTKSLL